MLLQYDSVTVLHICRRLCWLSPSSNLAVIQCLLHAVGKGESRTRNGFEKKMRDTITGTYCTSTCLQRCDLDGDGKLNYPEFRKMMFSQKVAM